MRLAIPAAAVLAAFACASAPRGPTDAEVRAMVDPQLQEVVAAVSAGTPDAAVRHFVADAVMAIRGVMAGDGTTLNVDLSGTGQIRSFLLEAGAPPDFYMQVATFTRTGTEATQTGQWGIAGSQTGTFNVDWRQNEEGIWQIVRWNFVGS